MTTYEKVLEKWREPPLHERTNAARDLLMAFPEHQDKALEDLNGDGWLDRLPVWKLFGVIGDINDVNGVLNGYADAWGNRA